MTARLYWDHGAIYRGGPDGEYLGFVWQAISNGQPVWLVFFPDGRVEACCSFGQAVAALERAP